MPLRPVTSATPAVPPALAAVVGDRPAAGEYVPPRTEWGPTSASTIASGTIALSFWTAERSEPINTVRVTTSTTAAAATPTLCRMGIYSVNAAGDLTALLAATANDTTLFAAANTAYSRPLTSQFDKVAGTRYATALVVVSGAAIPNFVGASTANASTQQWAHMFELPTIAARVLSQTDLGASYTRAQQASVPGRIGFTLT